MEGQFDRVKGAPWFPLLHNRNIFVIGQGGIGSWLTLLLARAGAELFTYDGDTFENLNMTGQLVTRNLIGVNKALAVRNTVISLSPSTIIAANSTNYTKASMTNPIVMCGLDSMAARKTAYFRWKELWGRTSGDRRKEMLFMDGRLLAEQLQIFTIPGDKPEWMAEYEKEHLFDDSEVEEAACTFKQTSHCAARIAADMVSFLTNWLILTTGQFRKIDFFYEHFAPLNLTRCSSPDSQKKILQTAPLQQEVTELESQPS